MATHSRIAITGAASLLGKEMNEALADSSFSTAEFLLFDDEEALGLLEAVGDEVSVVQRIEADSFNNVDFAFFAGAPEFTRQHWQSATHAGASVIDLTDALEDQEGVLVRAPWITEAGAPDLGTPAVIAAHPAAIAVALLAKAAASAGKLRSASATVLIPASEHGRAAIDELQQQTIGLLNFQNLAKNIFDTQAAFNLSPIFGEEGKLNLPALEATVRKHYALLRNEALPETAIQLVHAPVFHGYGISMALDYEEPVRQADIKKAFRSDHLSLQDDDAEAPTNLSSAGQENVLVRVRSSEANADPTRRYWLWATADNLRIATLNAIACATELGRLRPLGEVQ